MFGHTLHGARVYIIGIHNIYIYIKRHRCFDHLLYMYNIIYVHKYVGLADCKRRWNRPRDWPNARIYTYRGCSDHGGGGIPYQSTVRTIITAAVMTVVGGRGVVVVVMVTNAYYNIMYTRQYSIG